MLHNTFKASEKSAGAAVENGKRNRISKEAKKPM